LGRRTPHEPDGDWDDPPYDSGPDAGPDAGLFASGTRWLVVSIVVLCLSLAAAGVELLFPDELATLAGAPQLAWRAGTPPGPLPPVLAAAAGNAAVPTVDGITRALGPVLADPALGGHPVVSVLDIATGEQLYERGSTTAAVPASTTKLITAVTVLAARGPAYRLTTRVVAGQSPGEVVLIGGGDATLAAGANATYPGAARLDDLATQVKRALGSTAPTRVVIDGSLFPGPATGPGWDSDVASTGYAANITALMIDGARTTAASPHGNAPRSAQPDLAAGQAFAAALGLPASAVIRGTAAAQASQLGSVQSPPMVRLVEQMLLESDNVLAECLSRQVALARNQPGSFSGAAAATKTVLGELGLPAEADGLVDGSGLSRANRLSPALLTQALTLAARSSLPQLSGVFGGLPVAGYSGTLRDRYRKPSAGGSAIGLVRVKTGTLSGVSAIAGIAVDADGRTLAFAVIAEGVSADAAPSQEALDRVAAALAGCGCR